MTHYCALGNQPRMKADPTAPANQLRFKFAGGCNIDPAKDKLLNVAAFTDPPPFQFGNVSRTLGNVRACGFANENITLNKTIPLHKERATLRIGIDTFNLLNRVQWAGPATDVDAPAQFGTITGTGTGRIVQLHARIDW